MNYRQEYEKWVSSPAITDEEHAELRATRAPYCARMSARMAVQTSLACSGVAVLPVPMAQMGS